MEKVHTRINYGRFFFDSRLKELKEGGCAG